MTREGPTSLHIQRSLSESDFATAEAPAARLPLSSPSAGILAIAAPIGSPLTKRIRLSPSEISGSAVVRAGGGGGAANYSSGTGGAAGPGGGSAGSGGNNDSSNATANTGGGSGGLGNDPNTSGNGGSGVVILRYKYQN